AAVPALVDHVGLLCDDYRSVDYPELSAAVRTAMNTAAPTKERHDAATTTFTDWLLNHIAAPDDEALLANRMVEAVENDPTIQNVTDLATHLHISTRSVQRLAATYVGVPPAFLIRRRRLQEAAELLRQNPGLDLTELAHESGYADHAHLT